jgi:protein-disulfide isomerase
MTSGKKARQERQAVNRPPVRSTGGRKASPKVLAIVAIAIALAAVAAVIVFVVAGRGSGSSGSSNLVTTTAATALPDADAVLKTFDGIPQHGNVLGSPNAPVTMVQYIDLQCPICRAFETSVMPTIIDRYVRDGKVKVVTRPIAFLGAESELGRRAALSAGLQNHLSEFSQLVYLNQGPENSGWLNDNLVGAAYASIPGLGVQEALNSRTSPPVLAQEKVFDKQATSDRVLGTPTVLMGKTGGRLTNVSPGGAPDVAVLAAAIKRAQASG